MKAMDFGAVGFIQFACYYVILKLILQFINIETRRGEGTSSVAAVSGLLA